MSETLTTLSAIFKRGYANMKTITTTIRIPEDLYDRIRAVSFDTRASLNQLMIDALEKHYPDLDQVKPGNKATT